ncbi:histidine phosphatase family protein [Catellatospora tritici]|uniref:histidine phosphatase family protein n=1 Tax=Catellatospora tritici TaxID=2851566 RepID=UPI001C2D5922|nr:histidine phosphatase family protein [Catellatospora tritici]MBV1850671.1 histidine phosphatase family protein [Catellatospora tritici]MBV1850924.1 histidine phosphatase family protein [Catellatospora tritici]
MRTRMVLVRHGDSVHKADGVVGGPHGCGGLTPLGHEQAAGLASLLAARADQDGWGETVAVYTSTRRRAVQTAATVGAAFGVEPTQDCGLCTWHVPDYADGMAVERFLRDHAAPGGGVFRPFQDGNETPAELLTRISRALVEIASRHRGATVIVVAHAETVAASFTGLGLLGHWHPFDLVNVGNATVTEWLTDDNPAAFPPPRWSLVRFNA